MERQHRRPAQPRPDWAVVARLAAAVLDLLRTLIT
jgi:hypothetical protein